MGFEVVHHGKDSPEEVRRKRIANHMSYCTHYRPKGLSIATACQVGCDALKGPCIDGHTLPDVLDQCPKWERRSLAEAEARADELERAFDRMEKVAPVINEWRSKPPIGKDGTVDCPICGGQLFLSQSARNGHVSAKCTTEGCVSFIE